MAKVRSGDGQGNLGFRTGWTLKQQGQTRYLFRRRGWRLVVERAGDGWTYTWCKETKPLGVFAEIVDPSGERWIVEPPERKPYGGLNIPSPRHPWSGLGRALKWADFMQLQGAPELAHERARLGAVAQVLKALWEAHSRDEQSVFDTLETAAARYLQKLTRHLESPPPRRREGLRLVATRPMAAEILAEWWIRFIVERPNVDPGVVVEEYLRDLWQGTYYAKITAGLAQPGAKQVAVIVRELVKARDNLHEHAERHKAAGRLCESCLHEVWQCEGGLPHDTGRRLLQSEAWDLAKGLVRVSLIAQGMPRAKARSLFDRQRKTEARAI